MTSFRYLALGDSYTIGESVPVEDRWPLQLARRLEAEGIQTEVTIIARTGWTVDELWQGIQAIPLTDKYDLVTLLIGVNNQYRGYALGGYQEDFRFLLGKAIEYAGGIQDHVVVLSIPDWAVTPFATVVAVRFPNGDTNLISQQIDRFNSVNLEETRIAGAQYVDITALSRHAADDPALIAADGLHPSGKMYALWAEKALPVVRDVLK